MLNAFDNRRHGDKMGDIANIFGMNVAVTFLIIAALAVSLSWIELVIQTSKLQQYKKWVQ